MALRKRLILSRPPLRDAACGGSSGQGGRVEGRTRLVQPTRDWITAACPVMTRHCRFHIRKTPKRVASPWKPENGALRLAEIANAKIIRVSTGSMTPSSHNRALA